MLHTTVILGLCLQESQRKVALLEAMVTALRDRLHEEEGRNEELQGEGLAVKNKSKLSLDLPFSQNCCFSICSISSRVFVMTLLLVCMHAPDQCSAAYPCSYKIMCCACVVLQLFSKN